MSQLMIDNRYRLLSKIGGGSFGEIFKGFDITTGKEIAIKLEKSTSSHPMLKYEARVYKAINQMKKSCFPKVYYDGVEGDFVVMVMDLCGPSLELLFSYCMRKFSTSTVLMLAVSLLQRVEALHFCNFIHRDLKPENFVMGLTGECSKVFLIDFGLAKRFRDPTTKTHISHATGKPLIGTARYASVNTQLGIEQSRRDDLEGIGMMLVYFLVGRLPWQGIKAVTRAEKDRKVTEKKIVTKPHILCQGLPKCFCDYLTYVRTLKFEQEPDYSRCRKMFLSEYRKINHGSEPNYIYDWNVFFNERRARGLCKTPPTSEIHQMAGDHSESGALTDTV